jgi:hypothetical protein
MIDLKQIVVVIADTKNYSDCVYAINQTLKHIRPQKVVWFTDLSISVTNTITYKIDKIVDANDYSRFIINKMPHLLNSLNLDYSHVLVIQHDGFVINGSEWSNEFLEYDYIGAPWLYIDGRNVGNGGFSLRSKKLLELTEDKPVLGPEDECIGRLWRGSLEISGCKFAPEHIASKFSYELNPPKGKTFGFHGTFHKIASKNVLVKRMGALGDVIQVEPVLRYFSEKGYTVYLETTPGLEQVFTFQPYTVRLHTSQIDYDLVVDLDMSYEMMPTLNHIEAYFAAFGERPKANPPRIELNDTNRIFDFPYAVMHIDRREQNYRNPVDNFAKICKEIVDSGTNVILIGNGEKLDKDVYNVEGVIPVINLSITTIMSIIWHSEFFIGIDSGPSHLAVAMKKKSVIYFGSVKPELIHLDLSDIDIRQGKCEYHGCWHIEGGTQGQPCILGLQIPLCCWHDEK